MTSCKVCGSPDHLLLEARERAPVGQNLVFRTREAAIACPTGQLDFCRCAACGFVWNDSFDPALMRYDATYDNDQSFSARFADHTDMVADTIIGELDGRAGVRVVEVGCGQGTFMAKLARRLGSRLAGAVGYDPAWKGQGEGLPPSVQVRGEYFGPGKVQAGDPTPDVVVSRHTIEHVPDPMEFLRTIRASVPIGTPVVVETPDVDWVLRQGAFFDLYYEHCTLFTPASLTLALRQAGFSVDRVMTVFDDQYLLAVARADQPGSVPPPAGRHGDLGYRRRRDDFLSGVDQQIEAAEADGSVALWGGASKAVTLCLTVPNAAERICCVVDINTRKQGGFLPRSGIPIVAPRTAADLGIATIIVVNPSYLPEIEQDCISHGYGFQVRALTRQGT